MKRLLAALAAVLCLSACSAKEPEPIRLPEQTTQTVEQTAPQTEQTAPADKPVEELPIQSPEQSEETQPVQYTVTVRDGLVEDAIGYVLEQPVFTDLPGAEAINAFYVQLCDYLTAYTKETVYEACMERTCVADVTGTVTAVSLDDTKLTVEYTYTIAFSNEETPTVNTRTDCFDIQTGEAG